VDRLVCPVVIRWRSLSLKDRIAPFPNDSIEATVELEGKTALVTGASRGVGAATCVALAEAGCRVACAARSTQETRNEHRGLLTIR